MQNPNNMKKEKTKLIAMVDTRSNYANLNGKYITILQFLGTVVYCEYIDDDGTQKRADFSLSEIISIKEIIN